MNELDRRGRLALQRLLPGVASTLPGVDSSPGQTADPGQTGAQSGKLVVRSPLTGSEIAALSTTPVAELDSVFAVARRVQKRWAAADFESRKQAMLAFHDLVFAEQEALLDLVQWETGKSRGAAFEEIADVAINARYYARSAKSALADQRVQGAMPILTKAVVTRQPKGVVAVISPWNYPLTLTASDALAALMAGNAVVLKPDSLTPLTALAVKALFERAGLPKDLFQVVIGRGSDLGTPMIERADYVMFTGSTATGRHISRQAGERLIGFSAELGGKNAMIVRADAPPGKAAAGAVKACFSNAGQLCISIERIYVHERAWDTFVPAFLRKVKAIRVEGSMRWEADMGPLISQAQLEKVKAHVSDARAKGATVLAGGEELRGVGLWGYAPTVLTGVTPDMEVFAEETFGPVVSLYRVSSDDDAVRLANERRYGLNAAIWTRDVAGAEALARRLDAGMVNINDGYAAGWGSIGGINGGMKESGMGHRHGPEGITKYTDARLVVSQRVMPVAAPPGLGNKGWAKVMGGFLTAMRKLPPWLAGK
ncbi:succinic semialdehyde dehydrogenase [Trueperella bialowiezensis]|nr:succinic semialdehyde dehydrogenase [Trueperella bialowiezensis]